MAPIAPTDILGERGREYAPPTVKNDPLPDYTRYTVQQVRGALATLTTEQLAEALHQEETRTDTPPRKTVVDLLKKAIGPRL